MVEDAKKMDLFKGIKPGKQDPKPAQKPKPKKDPVPRTPLQDAHQKARHSLAALMKQRGKLISVEAAISKKPLAKSIKERLPGLMSDIKKSFDRLQWMMARNTDDTQALAKETAHASNLIADAISYEKLARPHM